MALGGGPGTDGALADEIERLHLASFGWALGCCRWNAEEAEEVLQVVYLKVLEGRARFDGRSSLKTWLFAVIRRTAAEMRRRRWPWGAGRRPVRAPTRFRTPRPSS